MARWSPYATTVVLAATLVAGWVLLFTDEGVPGLLPDPDAGARASDDAMPGIAAPRSRIHAVPYDPRTIPSPDEDVLARGEASRSGAADPRSASRVVPARRFSIVVRHGAGPVPRGSVWVLAVEGEVLPGRFDWHAAEGALCRPLDADGAAVFEGLAEGIYLAGLEIEGAVVRECVFRISIESRLRRLQFNCGGAKLEGRVVDAQGRPLASVLVQLAFAPRAGAPAVVARTMSGPDGRYALAELPPGPCTLSAAAVSIAMEFQAGELRLEDLILSSGK